MTAEPKAVCELLEIPRIRGGKRTTEELLVRLDGGLPHLPLRLTIHGAWTGSNWKATTRYVLAEVGAEGGRLFLLEREKEYVERQEDDSATYAVYVAAAQGQSRCDCRGFAAKERDGQQCKHAEAVGFLVKNGHL